jgi:hypothetical protein
VRKRKKFYRKS